MQNTAPVTALSLIHNLICELADDQLIEQEEGMLKVLFFFRFYALEPAFTRCYAPLSDHVDPSFPFW